MQGLIADKMTAKSSASLWRAAISTHRLL